MRISTLTSSLLALALTVPALAQPVPQGAPRPAGPAQGPRAEQDVTAGYILGADDVVEVAVLGQPEFTTRARVRANGTVQLPFIGETQVAGETALSLSRKITEKLRAGGYYARPVVTAEIVNFASRYVIVLGDVAQPGLQPVDRDYRVSEVLARAGGLRDTGADFVVLRRANGEELKLPFNRLATGSQQEDPVVQAGDKLYVPAADLFYIYGQVNAPGVYPIKGEGPMTIRKALARGGGVGPSGSTKKIKVFRNGEEIKVKLDDQLRPGDVVTVGERVF
jgi:polysaccharide export outer membrane protein